MKTQIIVLAFLLVPVVCAGDTTLDALVAAKYPDELIAFGREHHLKDQRQQSYVTLSRVGVDYIVAAYSNGNIGAVELLQRTADGTVVDSLHRKATGKNPEIELQDLDGDGNPEVSVRFDVGHGSNETWIYRLGDKRLTLISPTEKHDHTLLGYPDFVDFGHGGSLDIVDTDVEGKGEDTVVTPVHYLLSNGVYVEGEPLDFYRVFYRGKAGPVTETGEFDVPASLIGKPFRLVIGNGGQSAPPLRVSSGRITLNGTLVSGPNDFSESRGSWTVPVTLQQHNVITVRLDGKPASRIAIGIFH